MSEWYPIGMLVLIAVLLTWAIMSPPPPPEDGEEDCFGPLT
jgi:hypothetical protein